jgi:hypothetical protein
MVFFIHFDMPSGVTILLGASLLAVVAFYAWLLLRLSISRVISLSAREIALKTRPVPTLSWRRRIPTQTVRLVRCKRVEVPMRHSTHEMFCPSLWFVDGSTWDIPHWYASPERPVEIVHILNCELQHLRR